MEVQKRYIGRFPESVIPLKEIELWASSLKNIRNLDKKVLPGSDLLEGRLVEFHLTDPWNSCKRFKEEEYYVSTLIIR